MYIYQAQYGCAPGIVRTKVGYAGGSTANPSCRSLGDHTEVIELEYDPGVTSFKNLLDLPRPSLCKGLLQVNSRILHLWSYFVLRQYRSIIFYHGMEQKMMAETSLRERELLTGRKIPTEILPVSEFHIAEE